MFEPYLCLGGVEIANPTRTLAYMANLGHGYLTNPPDPRCSDCFGNERPMTVCEVPYAIGAGFDLSVAGEMAASITEMYRGAAPVTRLGVQREVRMLTGDDAYLSIPPVPDDGWVVSDYVAPFTLPLVLSEDAIGDACDATKTRWERWRLYDIERFPVPATSAPPEGGPSGYVEVLFFIDPCSAGESVMGLSSVSFDGGATWSDLGGVNEGEAFGAAGMRTLCTSGDAPSFIASAATDSTGLTFGFSYVDGGSGHFDVEVWYAPAAAFKAPPPPRPLRPGVASTWLLGGLGQLTGGEVTVGFPAALTAAWGATVGGYYQLWRYTDRITRQTYDLVVALRGPTYAEKPASWEGELAYSLDGGGTWHTPTDTPALVVPVSPDDPVATGPVEVLVDAPYTTPAEDNAPWYDPAVPESADVLGVWIESFVSPSPYNREVKETQFGGRLGRPRLRSRELLVTGYVYAKSCEASRYAKRWLRAAMSADSCSGCDLPDAVVFTGCNPTTDSAEYARTIRRVGLIELDTEVDPEFPCCLGFKFEATLRSELPHVYADPITVYEGPVVDMTLEPECNICSPCPPIDPAPAGCGCMEGEPAHIHDAEALTDCYCAPARVRRLWVPIDPPGRIWSDATVRVTVNVGQSLPEVNDAIRNLRIVGFQNPLGLETPDVNGDNPFYCQDPCVEVEVSCLPAMAELVVDGSSRRSTVTVGPRSLNGNGYLTSAGGRRFEWPDVGCQGLMLVLETDAVWTAADSTVRIELIPRELP
jgi:hypothetical protein